MTGHHGAFYRAVVEPDSSLGHTCGSVKNDFVRTNQSSQWPLGTIRVVEAREEGRDGGLGPWSERCNIWYWLRLSKHKEKKHLGLKVRVGAGEMAQYLWARTALPAPSPVSNTHSGWLSTACSSSFRGSHAHFWPSLISTHMCTDTQVTYPKKSYCVLIHKRLLQRPGWRERSGYAKAGRQWADPFLGWGWEESNTTEKPSQTKAEWSAQKPQREFVASLSYMRPRLKKWGRLPFSVITCLHFYLWFSCTKVVFPFLCHLGD